MFRLRQNGSTYEIILAHYSVPTMTPVETVILTTDIPEEAHSVLTTLNASGIDSLRKVATDAGKAYYRTNINDRNLAIIRRHFTEGESIQSLAKRFRIHQSTIRVVLDDYRKHMRVPATLGYGGHL